VAVHSQVALGPKDAAIVTKAVVNAADRLDISGKALAGILGLSEPTISRLKNGTFSLENDRKAYELAVLFIRLYRSLDAIVGGDPSTAASWFSSHNTALDTRPIDAAQTIPGLIDVIQYLDARRAPI
jgi:transcriptional regulator with XRE-family HTH domain